MNSMELNKIAAAVLLAGVIAMGVGFVANLLVPAAHDEEANLFADLAPADPDTAAPAAPTLEPVEPILASMDIEELVSRGETVARRCTSCHTFDEGGPSRVGPNLWNVVMSDKAHVDGFGYSSALEDMEGDWTYDALNAFLFNPRDYVPGTTMSFAGLRNVDDRAAIIAYMRSFADEPAPLPEPEEEEETAEDEEASADEAESEAEEAEPAETD